MIMHHDAELKHPEHKHQAEAFVHVQSVDISHAAPLRKAFRSTALKTVHITSARRPRLR